MSPNSVQPRDGLGEPLRTLEHFVQGLLKHLRVEKLFAVLPLVDRLRLVEPLVALQANERQGEHLGGGLGQFGLADARRAFDQHRLAQVERQVDGGSDLVAADVPVRLEALLQGIHRTPPTARCLPRTLRLAPVH